jgi:chromatin remodeling complex protein RSC6
MPRGKKVQKTQEPSPEPTPEPEVVQEEEETVEQVTADEKMSQLITDIESLARIVRGVASDLKKVRRAYTKEHRNLEKAAKGKKKRNRDPNAPPRAPSGFNKPGPLSKDLCKFLKVPAGTELSRPDVTKRLTQYIKAHNLQNEENKREILPDKYLAKLLSGPTDGTPLTFFNLQRYIKHHFPKGEATS